MAPERDTLVGMQEVSARRVWWAFVVAKARSKVGGPILAIGLCVAVWQFWAGHALAGFVIVAGLAFNYACVAGAVGLWLAVRGQRGDT
jgi:hypothetical protein